MIWSDKVWMCLPFPQLISAPTVAWLRRTSIYARVLAHPESSSSTCFWLVVGPGAKGKKFKKRQRRGPSASVSSLLSDLVRWEEEPGLWFQGGTRGQCEPKGFQAMPRVFVSLGWGM